MTSASDPQIRGHLLAIAQRLADSYAQLPQTQAVALVGSVARDQADSYSDLDMSVYFSTMPTDDEIVAARNRVPHENWRRYPGGEPDDFFDIYYVDGVECQVVHVTIDRIDHDFKSILDDFATDHELHVLVGGVHDALPLYGEAVVKRWQAWAATYPDGLAEAMVRKYIAFPPLWVLEKRLLTRDAPLLFQQFVADDVKQLLSLLSGLNRLYPQLHFKRLDTYCTKMRIAPPDVSQRLKQVLASPPESALDTLRTLILETLALVETHMPAVDTTVAREKFAQPPRQLKRSD